MFKNIIIYGEKPTTTKNPFKTIAFREKYPKIFAPLQSEAFFRIKKGCNLVLIAPTSAGKTMAVAAPLFELSIPTVFVYPFRALVLDQTNELIRLASLFGISQDDFAPLMGGSTDEDIVQALNKKYILITPDKLISFLDRDRNKKTEALAIISKYHFVFDEIHVYNPLMRTSLIYFLRTVKYWRTAVDGNEAGFYFLSATFPPELWSILQTELDMTEEDRIEGTSYTGNVELQIKPNKTTVYVEEGELPIVQDIRELGITTDLVGIFNSPFKAWQIAKSLEGLLFVGQDKMSEKERVNNFQLFLENPQKYALIGSNAIEAGVDFSAKNLVFEETNVDSFLQRFGRAARSGKNAFVLVYSDVLYKLLNKGELKEEYQRREFLQLVQDNFPDRQPKEVLSGLAAYAYYKFWDKPSFLNPEHESFCHDLENQGVKKLLAFRGLTPYNRYETGEYISYKTLFKKDLQVNNGKVVGSPSVLRFFYSKDRTLPVTLTLLKKVKEEKINEKSLVILAKVKISLDGKEHWVLLELINDSLSSVLEDDNIKLVIKGKVEQRYGRTGFGKERHGIIRFYEQDW